jgi:hypothetical protein
MLRRIVAFVVAAAAMVVVGSFAQSYLVQRAWSLAAGQAVGRDPAAIPFADRIAWAAHDLRGMLIPYAGTTSLALLIALLLAGVVVRFSGRRAVVFGIAGALAMLALFTVLKVSLGTVGIFGARGAVGIAAQMAAGLSAGALFAKLSPLEG